MEDAVREQLLGYAEAGRIPCALAFRIAASCRTGTQSIREAADGVGIRISECQLGLFGYEAYGEKRWTRSLPCVPPALEAEVRAVAAGGRLSCAAAWKLADDRGMPRLLFGCVVQTLGLRVSDCQLGCFE